VRSELGFSIVDLKSSHGTFVNGHQVDRHELQAGDRIALGKERLELIFYTDEGETASKQVGPENGVDDQESSVE
jgi:pSer/pThr/pTyr-binding forkhead associated (FHA) protein